MLRRVRREDRTAGPAGRGLSRRESSAAFSVIPSVCIDGTIYGHWGLGDGPPWVQGDLARRAELSRAFDLFEKGRECLLAPSGSPESFSFDELVASSVASNGASGVAVEGKTGGRVSGDRSALEQALSALLTNAIEASGADSV